MGITFSLDFPGTGFAPLEPEIGAGFMLRLRADGSAIDWSQSTDGALNVGIGISQGVATAAGVAIDERGRTHVVGSYVVCVGSFLPVCSVDVGVQTRGANGEALSFITFGGSGQQAAPTVGLDIGRAIAATASSVWVTGVTYTRDFPTTPGTLQPTALEV